MQPTKPPITRRGAMAVVLSEDRQQVLLLRREIFILWDLPGGGIDQGEEPAHAAVRECREETGYIIELDGAVGEYLHQSVYGLGDQLTYAFRGHVVGGKARGLGLETMGLAWYPIDRLPRGLEPLHRQIIADALENSSSIIERRIDFARWKLYPARVVFTIMSTINKTIRRFL
ncbi:MAG: NUDIX domain-containing protein [Chloroflexi bacterium]|nr:NUDIX domain-containing protein [Chloroflexota bacterium]